MEKILLLSIFIGVFFVFGMYAQEELHSGEDFFPEDTILFYSIPNVSEFTNKMSNLPVVGITNDITKEYLNLDLEEMRTSYLDKFGITQDNLKVLFPGEMVFGIYKKERGKPGIDNLEWVLILRTGPMTDALMFTIDSIFRQIKSTMSGVEVNSEEYFDYIITVFRKKGNEILNYALTKSYLIVTSTKNELIKTVYRIKKRRQKVFRNNQLYKQIRRDENQPADARFFIDAVGIAELLNLVVPAEIIMYLRPTGVLELRGIYGRMVFSSQGVKEDFVCLFDSLKGVLSLFEGTDSMSFDFSKIPGAAWSASGFSVDPLEVWDTINEIVKQFEEVFPGASKWLFSTKAVIAEAEAESGVDLQDDIISNIDGNIVFYILPVQSKVMMGSPLLHIFTAKIYERNITERNIVSFFKGLKLKLSKKRYKEQIIYYRQFEASYFSFVFFEDMIYICDHPDKLIELIDFLGKKRKAITENKKFNVFLKDRNINYFGFLDFEPYFRFIAEEYNIQRHFSIDKMFRNTITLWPEIDRSLIPSFLDDFKLPDLAAVGKRLNVYTQKVTFQDNFIIASFQTPVPMQMVFAATGVGVIKLIPIIKAGQEKKREEISRENLNTIAVEMEMYALYHNWEYPNSLKDLYPHYIKSLNVFAAPGMEDSIRFKDEIDEKGCFVLRDIKNLHKVMRDKIRIYQKNTAHKNGFFVLMTSGEIIFFPLKQYDELIRSFSENTVEIIE